MAVCVLWNPAGVVAMAAGATAVSAVMLAWLAGTGALAPYWEQVWRWGRLYAARPFEDAPLRNGILRTLGWAGFHAAIVIAAACCWIKRAQQSRDRQGAVTRVVILPQPNRALGCLAASLARRSGRRHALFPALLLSSCCQSR